MNVDNGSTATVSNTTFIWNVAPGGAGGPGDTGAAGGTGATGEGGALSSTDSTTGVIKNAGGALEDMQICGGKGIPQALLSARAAARPPLLCLAFDMGVVPLLVFRVPLPYLEENAYEPPRILES
ncbi:MAG TPA: hypothetical protein VK395_30340 [Gemmataceae bacterium]|nr:hypothetical protein [Gemmataceae bacterium]